jgi:ubiquinone/menaquinone biosynthesis C-methylase UbiE
MTDNKSFWNRFAGLYDKIIRKDADAYRRMYRLMSEDLRPDMEVLELATGTGVIALNIAGYVRTIEATDFSPEMIANAKKKPTPGNVTFSIQNAVELDYEPECFDAVIISNALHIMPNPELALSHIRRVLKPDGILLAPTFARTNSIKERLRTTLMGAAGFHTYSKWTPDTYPAFLERNGFHCIRCETISASFPLVYVVASPN